MAWWCFVHLSDWKIDTATLSPSNWTSFDDIWHRGFLYPQIIHILVGFFHYKPDMLGSISGNLHMNIHPTARPCGTWSSLKRSVCSWQTSCVTMSEWLWYFQEFSPTSANIYPTSAIHNMFSWSFWTVRPWDHPISRLVHLVAGEEVGDTGHLGALGHLCYGCWRY